VGPEHRRTSEGRKEGRKEEIIPLVKETVRALWQTGSPLIKLLYFILYIYYILTVNNKKKLEECLRTIR
jgi:hypothetical protein